MNTTCARRNETKYLPNTSNSRLHRLTVLLFHANYTPTDSCSCSDDQEVNRVYFPRTAVVNGRRSPTTTNESCQSLERLYPQQLLDIRRSETKRIFEIKKQQIADRYGLWELFWSAGRQPLADVVKSKYTSAVRRCLSDLHRCGWRLHRPSWAEQGATESRRNGGQRANRHGSMEELLRERSALVCLKSRDYATHVRLDLQATYPCPKSFPPTLCIHQTAFL